LSEIPIDLEVITRKHPALHKKGQVSFSPIITIMKTSNRNFAEAIPKSKQMADWLAVHHSISVSISTAQRIYTPEL
jgi:hypothetical protein